MDETFNIRNTTQQRLPRFPYEEMKEAALGRKYSLSLVFCGDRISRRLNRAHRGKDRPTNILSYELERDAGEIFINLRLAKRQAKGFDRSPDNFAGFLFIHGLVHLKGYEHGSKMEDEERKLRKRFGI